MQSLKLIGFIFLITFLIFVNSHRHGHHHHHHHQPKPQPQPQPQPQPKPQAFYKFDYGVKDPQTGDIKQQWETRVGDQVKGAYELNDADGTKRVVEYIADKQNGFNAIVKRIGHAGHPAHAPKLHGHHRHGHHGPAVSYSNVYLHH